MRERGGEEERAARARERESDTGGRREREGGTDGRTDGRTSPSAVTGRRARGKGETCAVLYMCIYGCA